MDQVIVFLILPSTINIGTSNPVPSSAVSLSPSLFNTVSQPAIRQSHEQANDAESSGFGKLTSPVMTRPISL